MFFLLADEARGSALVADLGSAGIAREQLHAVTGGGRILQQFPPATAREQRDIGWRLQRWVWAAILALLALTALGLALALYTGHTLAAVAAAGVLVAAVAIGVMLVYRLPDTHLGEFNIALGHGDIVLMVDVPKRRVTEIAQLVRRRHPEAEASGIGWTIAALGI